MKLTDPATIEAQWRYVADRIASEAVAIAREGSGSMLLSRSRALFVKSVSSNEIVARRAPLDEALAPARSLPSGYGMEGVALVYRRGGVTRARIRPEQRAALYDQARTIAAPVESPALHQALDISPQGPPSSVCCAISSFIACGDPPLLSHGRSRGVRPHRREAA